MTQRTKIWTIAGALLAACGVIMAVAMSPKDTSAQPRHVNADYVSHNTCKLCHNQTEHGTQWNIWHSSPHPDAYKTLYNEESQRIVEEKGIDTPAYEAAQCLRCHVTAYDPQQGRPPEPLRIADGVQCESCHGPGSKHVPDGRRYWVDGDRSVNTAANIIRPNQRTCVRCHRPLSPTWDPERYTLPDGRTTGFDFQQAFAKIAHPLKEPFLEPEAD